MKPKNQDLNDWMRGHCGTIDMVNGVCEVLGESFDLDCCNVSGEKCRYWCMYEGNVE